MLRAYLPTSKDLELLGLKLADYSSPFGPNFDFVNSPKLADVILMQPPLRPDHLNRHRLAAAIQHFGVDPRRVVAYDCSDDEEDYSPEVTAATFIRCSAKGWYVRKMPRTISWPWPVEDFKDCVDIPAGGFKYKVGFQGWMWSNIRHNAIGSVRRTFSPGEVDITTYQDFYGYVERDNKVEADRRKAEFRRSMRESLLELAPASIHNVFPYRFFEAMSAGRVPVLFCTDYVLPFEDKIDYSKCVLIFREDQSQDAGPLIKQFLADTPVEKIVEMGTYGRLMWDTWLNRDKWNTLFPLAISESLKKEGLL